MFVLQLPPWHQRLTAFIHLARIDRPIGTYLVMWPTLWALFIAGKGLPQVKLILIFILGCFLMRSAGCVINDFADRKIDGHVLRTKDRPLATGQVTVKEALTLFVLLLLASFGLALLTNWQTLALTPLGLLLAASYPFMKRYTHFPQVVLGIVFSWGIPMAFTAQTGELPKEAWLIFAANFAWTVAYDTMYALEDREDDLKIGVKSTAVFFGKYDLLAIAAFQLLALGLLVMVGKAFELGGIYYLGLIGMLGFFIYQLLLIKDRQRGPCLAAFLNNHYAGMWLFVCLVLDFWLASKLNIHWYHF